MLPSARCATSGPRHGVHGQLSSHPPPFTLRLSPHSETASCPASSLFPKVSPGHTLARLAADPPAWRLRGAWQPLVPLLVLAGGGRGVCPSPTPVKPPPQARPLAPRVLVCALYPVCSFSPRPPASPVLVTTHGTALSHSECQRRGVPVRCSAFLLDVVLSCPPRGRQGGGLCRLPLSP